jgi:hypothetical protein
MEQQDDRENLSGLEYTAYMSWVAEKECIHTQVNKQIKTAPRVPVATACQTVSDLEKPF